jgi:Flp pilus assembly protein TadD
MRRLLLLVPFLVALAALSPALAGGFCWDDRQLILDNPDTLTWAAVVRAVTHDFWDLPQSHEPAGYWRPAVTVALLMQKAVFGVQPLGWHVVSWAAHATLAGGLGAWLRRCGLSPGAAALAASLWSVQPAILEPSCWVSGQADLGAAALCLAIFSLENTDQPTWTARRAAAVACFALALTVKEAAIGGAFALAVLRWPGARGDVRTLASRMWPYLAVLFAYAVFRLAATPRPIEPSSLSLAARVLAVPHLLGVLVAPWFGRVEYGTDLDSGLLVPGAAVGAVVAALAWRAPSPLARAGIVAFIPGALAVLARGVVADRLVYLPGMLLIPGLISLAWTDRRLRAALPALVGAFAMWSHQRSGWWADDATLFTAAEAQGSPSPRARLNLGIAVHQQGDLQDAERRLRPLAPDIREAAYETGLIWTEAGCYARAEHYYRRALDLDPSHRSAGMNLITLLMMSGRPTDAQRVASLVRFTEPMMQTALSQAPERPHVEPTVCQQDATARAALGDPVHLGDQAHTALVRRDFRMADALLRAALRRDPDQRRARLDRAQSAALQGDLAYARQQTDALRTEFPGDAAITGLHDWLRQQGH